VNPLNLSTSIGHGCQVGRQTCQLSIDKRESDNIALASTYALNSCPYSPFNLSFSFMGGFEGGECLIYPL
jgi:hypothetical protein